MGKIDSEKNRPTNSSLSWTLDHLTTKVVIEKHNGSEDLWEALETPYPFTMSQVGRDKYLNHFLRIKKEFGASGTFKIKSGNNFPADCGIASSASSFAALTEAACLAFSEITGRELSLEQRAQLSSLGSGSSCRSFLGGLVQWNGERVEAVESQLSQLLHMVAIVGDQAKKVTSSQAHKIVSSSLLFEGRVERADKRLRDFIENAKQLNWAKLYQVSWEEFWDMHALFETSRPHFGYFLEGTIPLLNNVRQFWEDQEDGPLVTMDAGPNIHFLWRSDQEALATLFFKNYLENRVTCLSNINGIGFAQV